MSMHDDIKTILVSEEQLKAKVAELGAQISRDYAGKNLVLVSILKGSVVFMADLMRAVSIPCSIDFMVVSSYGGGNTTSTASSRSSSILTATSPARMCSSWRTSSTPASPCRTSCRCSRCATRTR